MPLPDHWEARFGNQSLIHVSMHCPHCDRPSTFAVTTQTIKNNDDGRLTFHAILNCNNPKCDKVVYVATTKHPHAGAQTTATDLWEIYPSGPKPKAHQAIHPPVGADWIEAQKAMSVGAMKAAAVMCRRVLYGVILHKGCKEHPLHEGIKELVALVRPPMIVEEWLVEIKDDGHDAAHPSRALEITSENVMETMEYTKELLRFTYIEPFELKERLARKTGIPPAAKP